MNKTSIEWADFTWNPVTGCHKVSAGCKNCYAEQMTERFKKVWGVESFRNVIMHEDRLNEPKKNQKKWAGKKVFVCSMSDLFQDEVPFYFIVEVYQAMANCPDTTFQILTKRPERCLEFYKWAQPVLFDVNTDYRPVKNIWVGTSVEDQETANQRIPHLIQIPAAVRFLSCEPLLGPIDLKLKDPSPDKEYRCPQCGPDPNGSNIHAKTHHTFEFLGNVNKAFRDLQEIHWVIVGGESGHNARPMHPDWVRSIRDQCKNAKVPFFFKQWGQYSPVKYQFESDITVNYNLPPEFMRKVGKSKSGNLLDGVQHLNFPTT